MPRDIQAGARGPPRLPVAALIGTIYVRGGSTVFSPRLLDQRPLEFSSFRFARLTIEIPSYLRGRRRSWERLEMVFRSIVPRVEFNDSFRERFARNGGGWYWKFKKIRFKALLMECLKIVEKFFLFEIGIKEWRLQCKNIIPYESSSDDKFEHER